MATIFTYIYNHMSNAEDIAPAYIFTGNKLPNHNLKYIHMWGCPFYVLDTMHQHSSNPLKLCPHYRHRIFVGFITNDPGNVTLILNPVTGPIYT